MLYYFCWTFVPALLFAGSLYWCFRDLKSARIWGVISVIILSLFIYLTNLPLSLGEIWYPVLLWLSVGAGLVGGVIGQHNSAQEARCWLLAKSFGGVTLLGLIGIIYTSTGVTNPDALRNVLRYEAVEELESTAELLDHEQAHYVDQALALKRINELTGTELGLTSRYEFATPRKQVVDNHLYWVAPLVNRSFGKWWNDGTSPGYAMVSASDISNAKLVLDAPTQYGSKGFYGGTNIRRHLRLSGYPSALLGASIYELRDGDHKPFLVTPIAETTIGYNGHDVQGVLVTDAQTGETQRYALGEQPAWVDRIFSEGLTSGQLEDWGKYIGNWWNAWVVGDNTTAPTAGESGRVSLQLILTKQGELTWYTGIQSASKAQDATIGFILTSSRTGKATFYRKQGLTEVAAASVMEGAVQEKGYEATPPIPYNVAGTNTYVSIMKDAQGNRQGFGLVAYDNRETYAVGDTPENARRAFVRKMLSTKQTSGAMVNEPEDNVTLMGTVTRAQLVNETLYLTIEGDATVFTYPVNNSHEAPLTRDGDTVTVTYRNIDINPQPLQCLDNMAIGDNTQCE